jgi:SAM-dependent methyltransferase
LLSATTIFLSAFLLFSLEPLLAKRILPWFGGSAAVWSTCLVFYQVALLVGYLYARMLTRHLPDRVQSVIHIALLLGSLAVLPVGPQEWWKPSGQGDPFWRILVMLTATVGLPFAALSATSPLLQHWLAQTGDKTPFRLFAVSNFASLAALISYPVLIEPFLDIHSQVLGWSVLYAAFAILCARVAWNSRTARLSIRQFKAAGTPFSSVRGLYWLALSACGSMLLLSITNHVTKNVAPFPFLWVLPLAIYLVTFILAFRGAEAYKATRWRACLVPALLALGFSVHNISFSERLLLPVFLIGLFVCCYFCHGELARSRPDAEDLTGFYVMLSVGGAIGAVFVGLIAPYLFAGIYELPLALVLTSLLALLLTWRNGQNQSRALWIAMTCLMALVFRADVKQYHEHTVALVRNFYGSLRVVEPPDDPRERQRTFFHGTIEHGMQFLLPDRRSRATTYYGPDSGAGIVLGRCLGGNRRIGIVGLGVGTLAAYGKPGDTFVFYEINPEVIEIANSKFTFLGDSRASVSTVPGDARLSLEHEIAPPYDALVLDAFSGDAIPFHLLTREAIGLYLRHLKPDGVLAFHLTNRFLDLPPVVKQLADEIGYRSVLVTNPEDRSHLVFGSSWMLVTKNQSVLDEPTVRAETTPISVRTNLRPWTDGSNNLFEVLKFGR